MDWVNGWTDGKRGIQIYITSFCKQILHVTVQHHFEMS